MPAIRAPQKTTLSFDVSVWEVFWPLIGGAGLVLARPGGQRDSAYLARVMEDARITVVHFCTLDATHDARGDRGQ